LLQTDLTTVAIQTTIDGARPHNTASSPVSIQTQSLALRALRKRKPQETQANSQSWLPLLQPSIAIGWRLRLFVKFSSNKRKRQPIGMLGRSSGNARNASDCV